MSTTKRERAWYFYYRHIYWCCNYHATTSKMNFSKMLQIKKKPGFESPQNQYRPNIFQPIFPLRSSLFLPISPFPSWFCSPLNVTSSLIYRPWKSNSTQKYRIDHKRTLCLTLGYLIDIKGALDKCNIIPNFFQKKLGFLYH